MYFYLPNIESQKEVSNLVQHFVSMRISPGDEIEVTDLKGSLANISILSINKKNLSLKWNIINIKKVSKPSNFIKLYISQTDKTYLSKMVETLGISSYSQIIIGKSDNTQPQKIDQKRLEKILIRSCQQSHKLYIPEMVILSKKDFWKDIKANKPTVMHQNGEDLISYNKAISSILIGPEGGWSKEEDTYFDDNNFMKISIGNSIYPAWVMPYTFLEKSINGN